MTDAVLATIDGAIHDWETGDDAMRHVPEHARKDLAVKITHQYGFSPTPIQLAAFDHAMRRIAAAIAGFTEALESLSAHERKMLAHLRLIRNGPPPLAVDGREYHRRQQARRRRR